MDYLYDGTYEGLLTCVYAHYYETKASGIYTEKEYQSSMLHPFQVVITDTQKARKVYDAIGKKLGGEGMRLVYRSFLSRTKEKENAILRYLLLGFKSGKKLNAMYSHDAVLPLREMERDVIAETHRLLGLLRFVELTRQATSVDLSTGTGTAMDAEPGICHKQSEPENASILYAQIEPDHDVIELMTDHFADRYKNETFIIHDIRREKAVFYSDNHWEIRQLPGDFKLQAKGQGWQDEKTFERLWKIYFETMAIKERINPKCQKNFMPARYWKNLTEFRQDI